MTDLRDQVAAYLQRQEWDAFFTATFAKHQRYSATAINIVERTLNDRRLRPVKMFIAAEQHLLGGWHCHGLLQYPDTKWREKLPGWDSLALNKVGFNRVSMVADTEACSAYLSKYLVKNENCGDYRFTGRKKFWT